MLSKIKEDEAKHSDARDDEHNLGVEARSERQDVTRGPAGGTRGVAQALMCRHKVNDDVDLMNKSATCFLP